MHDACSNSPICLHNATQHLNRLISNVDVAHIEETTHEFVQRLQPGGLRWRYFHGFVLNQLDDRMLGPVFAHIFDDIVDFIRIGSCLVPLQQLLDFIQRLMKCILNDTILRQYVRLFCNSKWTKWSFSAVAGSLIKSHSYRNN